MLFDAHSVPGDRESCCRGHLCCSRSGSQSDLQRAPSRTGQCSHENKDHFRGIAFAIYYAGRGASNFGVFKAVSQDKLASLQGKLEID